MNNDFVKLSARPEVRGMADTNGGTYSLAINPPRTHSRLYHHPVCGPTGGDGHEWLNDADVGCAAF